MNCEAWELYKGGDGGVELDYECIKSYSKFRKVDKPSGNSHVDSDVVFADYKILYRASAGT